MDRNDTLKSRLAELADYLDRRDLGGAAIARAAIAAIDELESQLRRPPRADPEAA